MFEIFKLYMHHCRPSSPNVLCENLNSNLTMEWLGKKTALIHYTTCRNSPFTLRLRLGSKVAIT